MDLLVDLLLGVGIVSTRKRIRRNGRRREDSCRRGYMKLYLSSRTSWKQPSFVGRRRLPGSTLGDVWKREHDDAWYPEPANRNGNSW